MNTISIITPVYKPHPEHLLAAYQSLSNQTIPTGWQLEWLIQADGYEASPQQFLPNDDRIIFGTGRHNGVAITRNLALSRASGSIVKNLDQDDILTEGAINRDIETLEANPHIGWTTTRVLDLLPDGSTVGFDNDPPAGQISGKQITSHWLEHNYRLPVHPTTLCIRRDLAVMLGGWMAVPGSDDTGLLVAASCLSDGWFIGEVGLLYRKWPGQASSDAQHTEPAEWTARMHLIEQRASLLSGLTWKQVNAATTVDHGLL